MAPPRNVSGLNCGDPLAGAARDIISLRLEELATLRAGVTGPEQSGALHDLRIAAKRLRYSLEMFAVCFPDKEAQSHADQVRAMQDLLGRIHDLDVLHDLLVGRLAQIDEEIRTRGLHVATDPTLGLGRDEQLVKLIDDHAARQGRLGIFKVIAAKAAERRDQYSRFETVWEEWEHAGVLDAILAMIGRDQATSTA